VFSSRELVPSRPRSARLSAGRCCRSRRRAAAIVIDRAAFASTSDSTVLYTALGAEGDAISRAWAEQNGGKTLSMINDEHGNPLGDYDRDDPVSVKKWDLGSQALAEQASGQVTVIMGESVNPASVWARVELPALNRNYAVTSIRIIDPTTGRQTALWVRGG
jgi:hypothetical protein